MRGSQQKLNQCVKTELQGLSQDPNSSGESCKPPPKRSSFCPLLLQLAVDLWTLQSPSPLGVLSKTWFQHHLQAPQTMPNMLGCPECLNYWHRQLYLIYWTVTVCAYIETELFKTCFVTPPWQKKCHLACASNHSAIRSSVSSKLGSRALPSPWRRHSAIRKTDKVWTTNVNNCNIIDNMIGLNPITTTTEIATTTTIQYKQQAKALTTTNHQITLSPTQNNMAKHTKI